MNTIKVTPVGFTGDPAQTPKVSGTIAQLMQLAARLACSGIRLKSVEVELGSEEETADVQLTGMSDADLERTAVVHGVTF